MRVTQSRAATSIANSCKQDFSRCVSGGGDFERPPHSTRLSPMLRGLMLCNDHTSYPVVTLFRDIQGKHTGFSLVGYIYGTGSQKTAKLLSRHCLVGLPVRQLPARTASSPRMALLLSTWLADRRQATDIVRATIYMYTVHTSRLPRNLSASSVSFVQHQCRTSTSHYYPHSHVAQATSGVGGCRSH